MRKVAVIVLVGGLVAGAALAITTSGGAATPTPRHDHVLFDGTADPPGSGDGVRCGSTGPFEIYGSFRSFNGAAVMRVEFVDGDFVDYPIPDGESFSFSHAAASSRTSADRIIQVKEQSGNIVGWLSGSQHLADRRVVCREN
jgi:hypothetical protein